MSTLDIYIVRIHKHWPDYKKCESESETQGVYMDKDEAYKIAFNYVCKCNRDYFKEEINELIKKIKRKKISFENKYKLLLKDVDTNKFLYKFQEMFNDSESYFPTHQFAYVDTFTIKLPDPEIITTTYIADIQPIIQ